MNIPSPHKSSTTGEVGLLKETWFIKKEHEAFSFSSDDGIIQIKRWTNGEMGWNEHFSYQHPTPEGRAFWNNKIKEGFEITKEFNT